MEEKANIQAIPEEELKKVSGGMREQGLLGTCMKSKADLGCTCDDNILSAEDCPPGKSYVGNGLCCP